MAGRKRKGEEDADGSSKKKVQKTEEHNFVCGECGKSYVRRDGLAAHTRMAHRSFCREVPSKSKTRPEVPRENIGGDDETALRKTEERKEVKLKYQCDICGKLFSKENYLNSHKTTTHKIKALAKRYKCSLCGKLLKRRHILINHFKRLHKKMFPNLEEQAGVVGETIEDFCTVEYYNPEQSTEEEELSYEEEEEEEELSYEEKESNPGVLCPPEYCPDPDTPEIGLEVEVVTEDDVNQEVETTEELGEENVHYESGSRKISEFSENETRHQWVSIEGIVNHTFVCKKCGMREFVFLETNIPCPEVIRCHLCNNRVFDEIQERDSHVMGHRRCPCCVGL